MKRETMDEVHHSKSHKEGDVCESLTFYVQAVFYRDKAKDSLGRSNSIHHKKKHGFS